MALSDDDAIERLASKVIDRSLPKAEWTHEAHFATALWLLRNRPDLATAVEIREIITRYNEATNTANTDSGGYHHTITLASMRAAAEHLRAELPRRAASCRASLAHGLAARSSRLALVLLELRDAVQRSRPAGLGGAGPRAIAVLSARSPRAQMLALDRTTYRGIYIFLMSEPDPAEVRACAHSCAAANVRRAARAVGRLYAESLAEIGLEPTQYSLLVACALAEGATVGKLAEIFLLDRSALARNLAVMEKRGLLRVKPGEDRRTRKVDAHRQGRAMLAAALPRWRAAQTRAEKAFGAERLAQARRRIPRARRRGAEVMPRA